MSQENLEAFCVEAARSGWQVGAHCVGDAAVDATLSAFEAADRMTPIVGRRWTLIHMMLAREDHWARANRLGLIVTAQQPLLYTLAEGFRKYVGSDRTQDLEPLRMYLSHSQQPVGGGSDSPVAPFDPLLGIWSSVTRQTQLAGIQGREWSISPAEALRMYTLGSAYAAFEEDQKGSITPGKHADLVRAGRRPDRRRARRDPRDPGLAHAGGRTGRLRTLSVDCCAGRVGYRVRPRARGDQVQAVAGSAATVT